MCIPTQGKRSTTRCASAIIDTECNPSRERTHGVLIMQHVSKELMDGFIPDMKKDFGK